MNPAQLAQISIYPIKSTRAINLSDAWVEEKGLSFDRRFVLVKPDGQFITARTHRKLLFIQSTLTPYGINVVAPDMPALHIHYSNFEAEYQSIQIWNDSIEAQICSQLYDNWFSDFLGEPCRLVFCGDQSYRNVSRRTSQVSFADGYPLLIISQASLSDLNKRLNQQDMPSVAMSHFRPNIVVNNTKAFAEDGWKHIRIGEVEFEVVKPCTRCVLTTVDPNTAVESPYKEPLKTLGQYRRDEKGEVNFGQNLVALNQGKISLGDTVEVLSTQKAVSYSGRSVTKHSQSTSKVTSTPDTQVKSVKIEFESWNKQYRGDNQSSILEQGEAAGLILPYSCRAGMCGRCKLKLDEGEVTQLADDGLMPQEKEQGYILACSCLPQTDIKVSKA